MTNKWFFFGTNRGDIIGQINSKTDVNTVEELQKLCEDHTTILIDYPVSPKSLPTIIARCRSCDFIEEIDQKAAEVIVANQGSICSKCGSKTVMPELDESKVKIQYSNVNGSLNECNSICMSTGSITWGFPYANQEEMENVRDEVFFKEPEEEEASSNIIQIP